MEDVIAARTLDLGASPVRVEVCRPEPYEPGDPGDVRCRFRIVGLENEVVEGHAGGVDGVQALLLALTAIGDRLAAAGHDLTFLGSGRLGFPRTDGEPREGELPGISLEPPPPQR